MAACEAALAVKADAERSGKQIRELLSAVAALDTAAQAMDAVMPDKRAIQLEIGDCKLALTSAAYDLLDAHTTRVDATVEALTAELTARSEASRRLSSSSSSAASSTPVQSGRKSNGQFTKKRARAGASPSSPLLPELLDVGVDPAEPTYCVCGQVAFGEMLMCTNPLCTTEWFHLPCVDIHPGNKPQGDWVCPLCVAVAKERAAAERARAAALASAATGTATHAATGDRSKAGGRGAAGAASPRPKPRRKSGGAKPHASKRRK
jgi:hypothetical protein